MDNFTTEQERALVARLRAEKAEAERDDVMRHVEKMMLRTEAAEPRADSTIVPAAEFDANARLIAAAPDLLAALKAMVDLDTGDRPELWRYSKQFDDARAAIAKAEGRSNG